MQNYPVIGKYARSKGPVAKPFVSLPSREKSGKWIVLVKKEGKR